MTKVYKNIKKLRTQHGLTQEDVAKKLFVTRQTVSSWESGRTQPDIETLMKLSELFSVSAEELIYGKSKLMSEEEKNNASRQKLIIIFSVLGSVLTAVGLVLIFVNYWDKFPIIFKSLFAFMPMLAGQGAAVYALIKHRDSIAWKEGASILWCAGIVATIALMDSVHLLYTDFRDCLFIDVLLTLPIIFILDAVAPLPFIHFGINYLLYNTENLLITNIIIFALLAVTYIYVLTGKKKKNNAGHIFAQWINLISLSVILISDVIIADVPVPALLMILTTYFAALYYLFFSTSFTLPYKPAGLIGTLGMSVACVFLLHPEILYAPYFGYEKYEKFTMLIIAVICVIIVTVTGILKRKDIAKNKTSICLFASTALLILSEAMCCMIVPENNHIIFYILTLISAFALAFSVISDGVLSNNFWLLNLGLIATAINLVFILVNIIDIDMLLAGILLLLFGITLFVVNFLLAKKIKKSKEENSNA